MKICSDFLHWMYTHTLTIVLYCGGGSSHNQNKFVDYHATMTSKQHRYGNVQPFHDSHHGCQDCFSRWQYFLPEGPCCRWRRVSTTWHLAPLTAKSPDPPNTEYSWRVCEGRLLLLVWHRSIAWSHSRTKNNDGHPRSNNTFCNVMHANLWLAWEQWMFSLLFSVKLENCTNAIYFEVNSVIINFNKLKFSLDKVFELFLLAVLENCKAIFPVKCMNVFWDLLYT